MITLSRDIIRAHVLPPGHWMAVDECQTTSFRERQVSRSLEIGVVKARIPVDPPLARGRQH